MNVSGAIAAEVMTTEAPFRFGTKAETLKNLAESMCQEIFCEQMFFSFASWRRDAGRILNEISDRFGDETVAVRSSAKHEDSESLSYAGAYESVIGVAVEADVLNQAIEAVFASYGDAVAEDQVLVQRQVLNPVLSGVVMTRDLDTGAPYYVINYDDFSGRTDQVTGGAISKLILVHRTRPDALSSSRMHSIVQTVQNIERATGSDRLDIEFCMMADGRLIVLQVRPLAASHQWLALSDSDVDLRLDNVRAQLSDNRTAASHSRALGRHSLFGKMPDWNPAEMIGNTPRPLAFSLYGALITDSSWAAARADLGYQDLRGRKLMKSFAGQPFIDVRLSLNSFLPKNTDPTFGADLIDHQMSRLAAHPEYHDKIEFQIAVPNADFTLEEKLDSLKEAGFSGDPLSDFKDQIIGLTDRLVSQGQDLMAADEREIDQLAPLLKGGSPAASGGDFPDYLFQQIENCAKHGVIPFARLARHGFIGVSFLKSLAAKGLLETHQPDAFLSSVRTIAKELVDDMVACHQGEFDRDQFLLRYGHLRPGTYDITSLRYDQDPEHYLGAHSYAPASGAAFTLQTGQQKAIDTALRDANLHVDAEELFAYCADAIRLRELAKFRFTRVVSHLLEELAEWGSVRGLDREVLSFLSLQDIRNNKPADLQRLAEENKKRFEIDRVVRLPHLLSAPVDVDVIKVPLDEPSYITQSRASGPVRELGSGDNDRNIDDHVVLIECADPGFDWIFTHRIRGLITKFGGANSHMAIRCAEFQIPAAIGCGERIYAMAAQAAIVELNCGARTVRGDQR